ncbi:MAG: 5-hydroxyisourate hydrolase [uncultured Truepera sp.]|uniref:5-hydroxyisourate hydrolase n=1 Tax=uncultured Truepera sp. TaxID=543023 RepID=A0A6J4VMP7_9DEIN|nr:MAG: 5-hydroxyisourate hydrolase [uncultured Truepera sp.]
MGSLSTHVLDTARGRPAAGLTLELWTVVGERRELLKTVTTNPDGRTDAPLLTGDAFQVGVYDLIFFAGGYFRTAGPLPEPAFLDEVVVRFGVSDEDARLHVPLLLSPYGYSTYRGS